MKNLKKVLSMMLALTMAMSLMTSAFAADNKDYTDTDKVSYNEAVEVMSAAGVFSGSNGKFDPQGSLTREQAAKIITYMVMGKDSADKLVSTIAPYADVNASRWSAGSIAYCTTQGIVAGSAGKFNPTAKVTGVEFAKMLLGALGYDAKIEKMLGAEWAVNTATLAVNAGLDDGMKDVALSAALTREQAAQMAFNAMQADMVKYENKGTEIKLPDGTKVVVGASDAEAIAQGSYANNLKKDNLQFAEKYSTDLKKVSTTDDFGRPSSQWKMKNNEIGNYADAADASYTTEVKLGDIYNDLGLSERTVPTVFEDGKDLKNGVALFKGNTSKIGANGVLTEAFVDDDNNVTIVETNTYVGTISKSVAATGNKDAYIVINTQNIKPVTGGSVEFETNATFEDDAYVLYTYANGEVQSVTPAKSVSGEVSSYAENKNLTVNGTKYDYSAKNTITGLTTKTDYVVYLDAYDFAIATDDAKFVSTDYAYVLNAQNKNSSAFAENKAELLFTDGTTKIVNTDKGYDDANYNKNFVTFKTNDKNEYVLRAVSGSKEIADTADFELTKGTAAIKTGAGNNDKVYANSETIFLVRTKTGSTSNPEEAFNVYTGISEVPSIKAGPNNKVKAECYTKSNGSIVTMMYIDAYNAASVSTSSKDITFLAGGSISGKITDSDNNEYYTYNAVVKGELTTVKVDAKADVSGVMTDGALNSGVKNALFSNVNINSDDIITSLTAYNSTDKNTAYTESKVGTVKVSGKDTLGFGNGGNVVYFTAAKDCKVFFADEDGVLTTGDIAGISTDEDDIVYYVVDDGEVTNVFVQTVDAGATDPGESQNGAYKLEVTNNAGRATVTVTSTSDTQVDVTGTVSMNNTNANAGAQQFNITKGTVKKNTNYTYSFATNSTTIYKVTVNVGNETLTSDAFIGG